MGLHPLEFTDCLTDSPYFRENLHSHEKELDRTSKAIKGLISECKELLNAAKNLSKAQRNFSHTLKDFRFECIGSGQTDDEITIAHSLKKFGDLISAIEDERDRMLERAFDQIIHPLENFRKEQIGGAKEGKKKFDKQTAKFCQSLERYLGLKSKSSEGALQEADAALDMERGHFYRASMQYVLLLQEVQERKKFEFVETLLGFMYGWLTFYHQGHETAEEFKPYMTDLQIKLQKCRENFDTAHEEAETLMNKMLEVRGTKPQEHSPAYARTCTREGYLYLMEKKALGTTWTKYYCQYQKENRILTMIPYNQVGGKGISTDTFVLTSCTRRATESIDKRFCFDITVQDRSPSLTLQALSEDDRAMWLDAMDGKEPIYNQPSNKVNELDSLLDDIGFNFIRKCISAIEKRGLEDQGLYRVVGVNSKVNKLTTMGLDRRKVDKLNLEETDEWEIKTITSALKNYFRSLPEPLMTFKLHQDFIAAARQESKTLRINDVHLLVHQLPEANFEMLETLIQHLRKVTKHSRTNLMTVSNIGVCFGPTLMRPEEETIAAIMDIKFCNIVVEIVIENFDKIFKTAPEGVDNTQSKVLNTKPAITAPKPAINSIPVPKTNNSNHTAASKRAEGLALSASPGPGPSKSATSSSLNSTSASPSNSTPPGPIYSNVANSTGVGNSNNTGGQTYAQVRAKLRPTTGFYSQFAPGEHTGSTSSSSESLNSKCSSSNLSNPSINTSAPPPSRVEERRATVALYTNFPQATSRQSQLPSTSSMGSGKDPLGSSTSSVSSISSGAGQLSGRKVRTLYLCEAENESELSFEPNQIIYNVRQSREPGWLEGMLNGRRGLIPANYVEFLN